MKIVKEFILREIAGESVLVPTGETTQEFNGLITMTDTAKFIWEHLETTDSFEELLELMVKEYDIDEETARADAINFIDQLLGTGFIKLQKRIEAGNMKKSVYKIGHTYI